jgi:HK97 family phage major capsid protein
MDELIFFGAEVKALGDGKLGGYLVRYGDPNTPDLTGDFFGAGADYGIADGSKVPVYYNHGFDPVMKNKRIGGGLTKFDEVGIWLEAQLEMRDEYERKIYELAESGKLGWSSGAAGHLVDRKQTGKTWQIVSWPIAEASLTPTPAEPRNNVMPIKSLYQVDTEGDVEIVESKQVTSKEESKMEDKDLEAILTKVGEVATAAADQAVKKYAESKEPEVKAGFVSQVDDEADRALKGNPFKTAGDFFQAVKNAAIAPHAVDQRLLPLKANGLNEAIPSQGGFLVQQDQSNTIWELMHPVGSLLARFNAIPVSGNGLVIPAIDETSRADGSRYGGIRGYWLGEGGTYTASKPSFRTIDLKLNKITALAVATDELLEDARALESYLMSKVPEELRFQVEAAIFLGDGVGKPLGILSHPSMISAVRTDAGEIDPLDIGRMWAARWQGVNDYVWLASPTIFPQLMNMSIGNMPVYIPPSGLDASPYGSLLGRPIVENEYSRSLGVLGDLMLVSPSQYALITKGGVASESSIHVYFTTGEQAFRFTARFGGQPMWTSTLTGYSGSTDVFSPFVALAATT